MVEKTPNHGLNKYAPGETDWSHSQDMQTIEERLVIRDEESNLGKYTPHSTATFVATDTNATYEGDGESWRPADRQFGTIEVDSMNRNRVYDSCGRYHGELTGSGDAGVVIDAIEDRASGATLTIPNPGHPLEWEQQVDLPADEDYGFAIETDGVPTLTFPSGFSGSCAFNKPASSASKDSRLGYRLGEFVYDDRRNEVLDRAIVFDDLKDSVIRPSVFLDTPGILFKASNDSMNQNLIEKPFARSKRGPLVEMEGGDPHSNNPEPDQNWIVAPSFADKENFTETAYIDRGRGNTWDMVRCEQAHTVFLADDAWNYEFREGQLDRLDDYTYVVKEQGPRTSGMITLNDMESYDTCEIVNPNTDVRAADRTRKLCHKVPFESLTNVSSFDRIGLQEDHAGGSASLLSWGNSPPIQLAAPSAGDVAELNTGTNGTFGDLSSPKLAGNVVMPSDTDRMLMRFGFYQDPDNYAEIIADPTNELGTGITGNYFFQVKTGGTVRGTADMVRSPPWNTHFSIQQLNTDNSASVKRWVAHMNFDNRAEFTNGGDSMNSFDLRFRLESTDDSVSEFNLRPPRQLLSTA